MTEQQELTPDVDGSQTEPVTVNPWLAWSVIGLVLCCVVFTLYSFISWMTGDSAQVAAIKEVIRQDIELKQSLSEMNDEKWCKLYVREADDADLVGCPKDFQQAYQSHLAVWREIDDRSSNGEEMGFWRAMWTVATLSSRDVRDALAKQEEYNRRAETTWLEVEQTALDHGVAIPKVQHVPFPNLSDVKETLGYE